MNIALPPILHRTGVYLLRDGPPGRYVPDEWGVSRVTHEDWRSHIVPDNEHLVVGDGAESGGVIVRMAIHLDATMPPDLCAEVGTIPIRPRPLPMWVGTFPLQTLPMPR